MCQALNSSNDTLVQGGFWLPSGFYQCLLHSFGSSFGLCLKESLLSGSYNTFLIISLSFITWFWLAWWWRVFSVVLINPLSWARTVSLGLGGVAFSLLLPLPDIVLGPSSCSPQGYSFVLFFSCSVLPAAVHFHQCPKGDSLCCPFLSHSLQFLFHRWNKRNRSG